jgi:hypothetical protein
LPTAVPPVFDWLILSETKSDLTQGSNYFLCFMQPANFVATLKEFSHFKKWQQTNMVLVFIFENEKEVAQAESLLAGYKFKDAILINSISNMELKWIAATYAILFNNIRFDSKNKKTGMPYSHFIRVCGPVFCCCSTFLDLAYYHHILAINRLNLAKIILDPSYIQPPEPRRL